MKLRATRVQLNAGGYDRRGRYWGASRDTGAKLYEVESDLTGQSRHVRAPTAAAAKIKALREDRDSWAPKFADREWYREHPEATYYAVSNKEVQENPWSNVDTYVLGGLLVSGAVAVIAFAVTQRVNPSFTAAPSNG